MESLKKQNLGLQRRQVQRDREKEGEDPLAEQVRHQLEALVEEKGKLAQENDQLWRENESLQELLMHSNMASMAEAMYSPGGALADLVADAAAAVHVDEGGGVADEAAVDVVEAAEVGEVVEVVEAAEVGEVVEVVEAAEVGEVVEVVEAAEVGEDEGAAAEARETAALGSGADEASAKEGAAVDAAVGADAVVAPGLASPAKSAAAEPQARRENGKGGKKGGKKGKRGRK